MRKKNLNYGGATWHVFINLLLGIMLFVVALFGGLIFHPLFYLLLLPVYYSIFQAFRWKRGAILEQRLKIREELIRFVPPKEGNRVLDVGTGGGLLAIGFAKAKKDINAIGIDLWIRGGGGTSLKTAKRNAEIEGVADRVKFKKADVRAIPYPDNYFDIVTASFVIHIVYKDRDKALKEMIRVLKPRGKFAVMEPPKGYKWKIDKKLKQKLEDLGLKNVEFFPIKINYPKKREVYAIYGEKKDNHRLKINQT
jgi:ubiquinone/menaquinone biosynthesis C-methylase UbiE